MRWQRMWLRCVMGDIDSDVQVKVGINLDWGMTMISDVVAKNMSG
jgi:hypothetical protein